MAYASNERELSREELQAKLQRLAREISSDLDALESVQSKELLSDFVSQLFLSAADQSRREGRRQKQAEGIAAAKAKGVRFGRPAAPLPDNFDQLRQAWRSGQMSLQQAASACGMAKATFYNAALRREEAQDPAV